MGDRKKIALLAAQPEDGCQNLFIKGFLNQAFYDDYDVYIFAMYQKCRHTKLGEQGESNIFSLAGCGLFEAIVVLADSIQAKRIVERIEEELHSCNEKNVIFAGGESLYYQNIMADACMSGGQPDIDREEVYGAYVMECAKAVSLGRELPEFSFTAGWHTGDDLYGRTMHKAYADKYDFNDSTLEDDMLMQTDFNGIVDIIYSYVDRIRPFCSFYLCFNEWMNRDADIEDGMSSVYSDVMIGAVKCYEPGKGSDSVNTEERFDRNKLIPESLFESDAPGAYYFTPLFFGEHNFGYAVISYGDIPRCYDASYKRWLGSVMRGLECYLRVSILSERNRILEASQTRDSLTGLYNYRGFLNVAASLCGEVKNSCSFVYVSVIELCGLNDIYMSFGSCEGERVIIDFSQMLLNITGNNLLCYLGNGEFLAAGTSLEENEDYMTHIVEDVRIKLADYCHSSGLEGKLNIVSGETYGHAESEENLSSLIGEAVVRKNAGKAKAQRRVNAGQDDIESKKAEIVADILDNNRLCYYFQPIVDANSGEIYAYEALMRADAGEPVSPLDILKYAEYLGRLCDVEKATFMNVLEYAENHEEQFDGRKIFINSIPGVHMTEENEAFIREKLEKFSGKLVVELTEQTELQDAELDELKKKYEKLGIDTAVDDYGTGYSNVYNLLRYMPDFVKIDRMLLANIQLSAQKQHFVKEVIEFAHNNKIAVLAEGVETPEELKMVTSLGVDYIQGYYTARPNAEVISKIDYRVQNEIVQYGQFAVEKSRRREYRAGRADNISLIKLAAGHYSKIIFEAEDDEAAGEGDLDGETSVVGLQGFQANMEIEIKDSYSGTILIKDADLAVHNEQPAIRLGSNCDVTLVLSGDNILEQGGILVPESSKLTIKGEGSLLIKQIAVDGYGIGNDKDGKHGDLYFEQDGLIKINGNTMHGVGIGAGYGGNIHINSGRYQIQLAGEEAVGIGALYSDVDLSIQYCAIDFDFKNSVSIGIGSIEGSVMMNISCASVSGFFNAKRCVCIGTMEGKSFRFSMSDGTVDLNARAEILCGIGNITGDSDLSVERFSVKIVAEGREAIALGNKSKTAGIRTQNGDLITHVRNSVGYDIGAGRLEIVNGHNEFILNGEEIIREIIIGDM